MPDFLREVKSLIEILLLKGPDKALPLPLVSSVLSSVSNSNDCLIGVLELSLNVDHPAVKMFKLLIEIRAEDVLVAIGFFQLISLFVDLRVINDGCKCPCVPLTLRDVVSDELLESETDWVHGVLDVLLPV